MKIRAVCLTENRDRQGSQVSPQVIAAFAEEVNHTPIPLTLGFDSTLAVGATSRAEIVGNALIVEAQINDLRKLDPEKMERLYLAPAFLVKRDTNNERGERLIVEADLLTLSLVQHHADKYVPPIEILEE